MRRDELKRLLRGVVVATPTPFDDDYEVDYGRMAEMTEWWVESGLVEGRAVIKCVSLMGEGPQLADEEWPHLVRTVVRAADGRVPVMGCIHAKDTKRSIADALKAQELGATGLQVSNPLFNNPNQDDILRYFEALSDAIEIGIMVYHTPWYPHGEIMVDTFRRMADFEQVMAIKSGQISTWEEMEALAPLFNILENGPNVGQCFRLGGQDDLVFDGDSVVVDERGEILGRAPQFDEHLLVVDVEPSAATDPVEVDHVARIDFGDFLHHGANQQRHAADLRRAEFCHRDHFAFRAGQRAGEILGLAEDGGICRLLDVDAHLAANGDHGGIDDVHRDHIHDASLPLLRRSVGDIAEQ